MISQDTIQRIFDTARIEEVIGDFVNLKKAGSNYKGLSPFSQEKTPSFMVSPGKQIFKDFSSGKGGTVVTFLMEHEQFTYPEALRYLAKKYNIEIEETGQSNEEREKRGERESLFLINEFANRYFQEQLWESDQGRSIGLSYFRERGFSDQSIKDFQLGYAHEGYEVFTQAALKESYQLDYLAKVGLTKVDGNRKTDRFRGRVIFPILSHTGRVLGFGGRTLKKDAKIAKYLNSPESEIYHKSKILYGIYQAKSHIGRQDQCFLVEGYTDVISLNQAGVNNVVASSGTALTVEQILLIKRYTNNITLLYDGDAAGIKASLRGIDLILEQGMQVSVVLFPDGEDPDSYAKKVSKVELLDYLEENSTNFLRFKARLLLEDAGNDHLKKSQAAREMLASIALIPDELERNAYTRETAGILDLDERSLFSELSQRRSRKQKQDYERQQRSERLEREKQTLQVVDDGEQPAAAKALSSSPLYEQEKALCQLLLNHGEKCYAFDELLEEEDDWEEDEQAEGLEISVTEFILSELFSDELSFNNPHFQKILETFQRYYNKEGKIATAENFLRQADTELMHTVVDLIADKPDLHDWRRKGIHPPSKDEYVERFAIESLYRYKERKIGEIIAGYQQKFRDKPDQVNTEDLETVKQLTFLRNKINARLNRII